jgi:hypothetical protein
MVAVRIENPEERLQGIDRSREVLEGMASRANTVEMRPCAAPGGDTGCAGGQVAEGAAHGLDDTAAPSRKPSCSLSKRYRLQDRRVRSASSVAREGRLPWNAFALPGAGDG